jgi:hypothetical protein
VRPTRIIVWKLLQKYLQRPVRISTISNTKINRSATTYAKRFDRRLIIVTSATCMCMALALRGLLRSRDAIIGVWTLFCLTQVFVYPALMHLVLASAGAHASGRATSFLLFVVVDCRRCQFAHGRLAASAWLRPDHQLDLRHGGPGLPAPGGSADCHRTA